jgi:hypothetical protein
MAIPISNKTLLMFSTPRAVLVKHFSSMPISCLRCLLYYNNPVWSIFLQHAAAQGTTRLPLFNLENYQNRSSTSHLKYYVISAK